MREFIESSVFFGVFLCIITYEFGLWLKKKTKLSVCNPLLISIALVIIFLVSLNISYEKFEQGAKYISFLLTPATVCLAVPLYEKLELLKKNIKAILAGIVSGVLASLVSILAMSILFNLSREHYITLLPKSITTAIGMGVAEELGGIPAITAAVIIITGVFGNVVAPLVLKIFNINDPIAQGIGLGTSAHAVGTAKAMEMGETQGAMSSLSIALSGILTVVGASIFAGFIK